MAHKKGMGSSRNGPRQQTQISRREELRRPIRFPGLHYRAPMRDEDPPRCQRWPRSRFHHLRTDPRPGEVRLGA